MCLCVCVSVCACARVHMCIAMSTVFCRFSFPLIFVVYNTIILELICEYNQD